MNQSCGGKGHRLVVSDPGQKAQMETVWDLQQLQSLRGRTERKRDLETIICVQHQLCGPVTIL